MQSIKQQEIMHDFGQLESWEEKYELLIVIGKKLQPLENTEKASKNLISGCSSRSWLVCNKLNDKFYFKGDSDSMIVKGLIYILIQIYSGLTKSEILTTEPVFITKLKFDHFLSVNRRKGLYAILEKIKDVQ